MTLRRAISVVIRGNFFGNNENNNESDIVENTLDFETINPPLFFMNEMQRELNEINAQRQRAQLITSLEKIRADRDVVFSIESLSKTFTIRSKEIDSLSLEKSFKTADPKTYTKTNQKNYEQFVRKFLRIFNQKFITYEKNTTKILY